MSVRIIGRDIRTVGQLREALENVPDSTLVNIGTENEGYSVNQIGYDGMSIAIMTGEVDDFSGEESEESEESDD